MADWTFFTAEKVFTDTPVELVGIVSVLAILIAGYRKIECHKHGCHRIGKFEHGHFKLCARHHPKVPSDGKIRKEHIDGI